MEIREMGRVAVLAISIVVPLTLLAQNQGQAQNQQNTQQNNQAQPQNQQAPAKKLSLWQRLKEQAKQAGQNTTQQGAQTVQQGTQTVQQNVQGVQQQVQQLPGQAMQQIPGQGQQIQGQATNAVFGPSSGANSSCGSSCFDAGPFQAAVTQMTMSQQGYWHIIRMNIQFHNATNQPLIIAYREGSMVMVDDIGNTYIPAGGNPGELQGMGIDRGNQTDSGFQLGPGQTGSAMFTVARQRPDTNAIGNAFTYNLTVDELQPQNGAQAAVLRQYNLNFPTLSPSNTSGSNGFLPSGSGAPANGYVAAPGTTVPAVSSRAVVGSTAIPGAKGAVIGATPSTAVTATSSTGVATRTNSAALLRARRGMVVNPATRMITTPTASTPAAAKAVRPATPAAVVNRAALRSPAPAPKPSPAVRPVPAAKKPVPPATKGK